MRASSAPVDSRLIASGKSIFKAPTVRNLRSTIPVHAYICQLASNLRFAGLEAEYKALQTRLDETLQQLELMTMSRADQHCSDNVKLETVQAELESLKSSMHAEEEAKELLKQACEIQLASIACLEEQMRAALQEKAALEEKSAAQLVALEESQNAALAAKLVDLAECQKAALAAVEAKHIQDVEKKILTLETEAARHLAAVEAKHTQDVEKQILTLETEAARHVAAVEAKHTKDVEKKINILETEAARHVALLQVEVDKQAKTVLHLEVRSK